MIYQAYIEKGDEAGFIAHYPAILGCHAPRTTHHYDPTV
jgi:predicted RNase H-like HicB family nuclease